MSNIFEPHSEKQSDVLFSTKPITIAATGIQWGKSTIGVMRLKIAMHEFTHPTDNFIVASPTYKILYQSTLPPFLYWNKGIGKYDKKNECFHIHGGGKVWFRTGTDPDSVVGITNVRHILCDEAGLFSLYFWENLQARSSYKQAKITIVTSPYSLNWLYRDYIRKHKIGDEYIMGLTHLCQAKSCENPYFPMEEYESKRRTMESRRFNMMYGGNFDKAQGLVYGCFDATKHWIDPINLPEGTRYYAGIDWGYTHPFVITVRAITPLGMHYQVAEYYATQQMLHDKLDAAHRLKAQYPIEKFFADPANPDDIASFNRAGLRTIAANNDIKVGIETHWDLINSGYFAMFRGNNTHTADEYEMYHYPEAKDLRPDQSESDKSELPVDKDNHCIAKGSLIYTNEGLKPIEEIKIGDMVRTRNGFNSVLNAWCSSESEYLVEIVTKTGKVLMCTGEHKIYTCKRGFVKAINLRYDDILISIGGKKWNQLYGKIDPIGDILRAIESQTKDILKEYQTENRFICTVKYGNIILAILKKVFTYITLMVILPITISKTLSVSILQNMQKNIPEILKKQKNILQELTILRKHGTNQKMAENYIVGSEKNYHQEKFQLIKNALSVENHLKQIGWTRQTNFAVEIVYQKIVAKVELMILTLYVSFARLFLSKIDILEQELVVDHVHACYLTNQKRSVYDLTVDKHHEFFANGILVSNCMDASRYVTMGTFTTSKKPNRIITSVNQDIIPARIASNYDLNRDRLLKKKRFDHVL